MMSKRIRPFSNGTEYAMWIGKNCDHCAKYDPERPFDETVCEIDQALVVAYFEDGTVSEEIWERMGQKSGRCTEFEPMKEDRK